MLGIIGGTGLYKFDGLGILEERTVETPFGAPSAPLVRGLHAGKEIWFLARHGHGHARLPHEVNYRANVFALKQVGVTHAIGVSAVGSLREEIAPGDLTIPAQYFDWTRGRRAATFFGDGVAAHVSTAEPTCAATTTRIVAAAASIGITIRTGTTYACVEGPRLGTRAESLFLRGAAACDVVGMTNVPEAFLMREAQIAYCTIAIATDWDCWRDDPSTHVTVADVIARYGASLATAIAVVKQAIATQEFGFDSPARHALEAALLTPEASLTQAQRSWIDVLRA
ncbi:MAG: S-methyl-5-thioadenosine phosphorylase [Rhodospirillales bacterium]|nr:S-methyl-5-thioadenosine phosphorylase [Rhodospirillales bacterium]